MALFTYTALTRTGSMSNGEITANDRADAFRRLDRNGLQPVSLKPKEAAGSAAPVSAGAAAPAKSAAGGKGMPEKSASSAAPAALAKSGGKPAKTDEADKAKGAKAAKGDSVKALPTGPIKLKRNDVIMFTEELSDLLAAGLQLEPALKIMESRDELSAVKDVTTNLRTRIRDGASFSQSLKVASNSFGELYCNLAAAGEVSGALPKILRRQSEYLVSVQALTNKVTVAMIYPICLMIAGLAVSILFVSYLIPQLTQLLKSMNKPLPAAAKMVMGAGNFFMSYWWLIGLVVGGGIYAFQRITTSPKYRESWDRVKLTLPFFGPLICQRFFVQFLETLSNLVGNGLPLLRALELTRDATVNRHLRTLLTRVIAMIGEGGALSRTLRKVGFFPSLLTDMITVGEQTGDLEHSLERTAMRYEKELQKTIDRGTAMVTPIIIFFMAIIVGTMAYLMVSVILESVSSIKR
ncbi:MAG: Type secretory pathway protein [Verrucomicrobiales bacterium]|nr:Type secretory pathway protein [Verrucomicrobiales bacterium]